ncbi:MAG: HAD family hydrolase [Candidatus Parcubacteria bacterium]|nr:HAD family hydrolase [Candidatus Parcubacteria bacterium]
MKKVAFFDRDGVINKKAKEHQYITGVENFVWNDGIFDLMRRLQDLGFEIIIITNQRGIARKIMTNKDLEAIHSHMTDTLRQKGVSLLDVFFCPHEENSCECRKPKPGLINQAREKYPIEIESSILISDSQKDIEMGMKAGLKYSIFIPSDRLDVAIKILDTVSL